METEKQAKMATKMENDAKKKLLKGDKLITMAKKTRKMGRTGKEVDQWMAWENEKKKR